MTTASTPAHILRFEEVEQMAFSREDFSVASTDGGADVFCLAGFLRDDDLICHCQPFRTKSNRSRPTGT